MNGNINEVNKKLKKNGKTFQYIKLSIDEIFVEAFKDKIHYVRISGSLFCKLKQILPFPKQTSSYMAYTISVTRQNLWNLSEVQIFFLLQ